MWLFQFHQVNLLSSIVQVLKDHLYESDKYSSSSCHFFHWLCFDITILVFHSFSFLFLSFIFLFFIQLLMCHFLLARFEEINFIEVSSILPVLVILFINLVLTLLCLLFIIVPFFSWANGCTCSWYPPLDCFNIYDGLQECMHHLHRQV